MNDPMDQVTREDMRPKVEFLALVEELRSYILSFLPWQDILRCTSVCKALRQTYVSSSELQYIVELGGQRLLPVPVAYPGNNTSVSQRLQLLRDKAHAWFQFNLHAHLSFSMQERVYEVEMSLADGHLCLWSRYHETEDSRNSAKIIPILPKPLQRTIERHWSPGSLFPVPDAYIVDVYMDPVQNLIAIAYAVHSNMLQEGRFYVDLRTLDGDDIHPQAAGQTLVLSVLTAQERHDWFTITEVLKLKVLGRHLALQCSPVFDDPVSTTSRVIWWLQLWDWQHSTTSNMQAQQTMWTSDPEHRLLCYITLRPCLVFVISTRVFFNLNSEPVGEKAMTIPWQNWGPTNTRVFPDSWKVCVSGNRVLHAFPAGTRSRYKLHMMDFSPLGVERRQGLGRVVREPSAAKIHEPGKTLITSLPYVEVVSDRVFDAIELIGMWIDRDRIYLAKMMDPPDDDPGDLRLDQLEVIEMSIVDPS
ncbi:hypothetical protein BDR07DRAFT_1379060 [Suillus spraguei]|nr:hypothetical protein BDR07DRAFT_1379060 [Suillus spraguei]